MNNRVQVEAVLDGSIMLGIGYFGSAADEDEREQLSTQAATSFSGRDWRAPNTAGFQKGVAPKLGDFHHEKFLTFDPGYGYGIRGLGPRILSAGWAALSLRSER